MAYDTDKSKLPGTPSAGPTGKAVTPKKPTNMLEAMKRRATKSC